MRGRKAAWLLTALLAGTMYLFGNGPGSLAVLIGVILIPAAMIVLSKLGIKRLGAELALPAAADRGQTMAGRLLVTNGGILPVAGGCRLLCRNLLTGEERELTLRFDVPGGSRAEIGFELASARCGMLSVSVSRLFVRDAFGLAAAEAACPEEKRMLVRPEAFAMELTLADSMAVMLDGDRYSMTKPGFDPSETFGLREYVPGDSVKSIHWKLSQKADRLMVRELGLPIIDRVLLLMETSLPPEGGKIGAAEIDTLAGAFAAMSDALLELGVGHSLGWKDMASGNFETCEINSPDDWSAVMGRFLENPVRPGSGTVAGCFLNAHERCGFTHVAVVSPYIGPDVSGLYNGNRITVLLCTHDRLKSGLQADGFSVVPFAAETCAEDLSRLEL